MFSDRREAGRLLAEKLPPVDPQKTIVFAIARGGAVIGEEIARVCQIPFYVLVIKKIGSPTNAELALGAVGPGKTRYIDRELLPRLGIGEQDLGTAIEKAQRQQEERELRFGVRYPQTCQGKTIILTDDGVATGATVKAAVIYLSTLRPLRMVLAVPVISDDSLTRLSDKFEAVYSLLVPRSFSSVGEFYKDFEQISDKEVEAIIRNSSGRWRHSGAQIHN